MEVEKEVVNRDLEPLPTEEEAADELPAPTAAESAQQDADYRASSKKLDEMISRRLKLEDVNDAFEEMKTGQIARSVIVFDA